MRRLMNVSEYGQVDNSWGIHCAHQKCVLRIGLMMLYSENV